MADRDTGAARRRRKRRMRSWWHHGAQQGVDARLATHFALRGRTTARAREVEAEVAHHALRGQKQPPARERQDSSRNLGRSGVTALCSAPQGDGLPTLALGFSGSCGVLHAPPCLRCPQERLHQHPELSRCVHRGPKLRRACARRSC